MRFEEMLPGGGSLSAHEAANGSVLQQAIRGLRLEVAARSPHAQVVVSGVSDPLRPVWRDYNGVRGPVPTDFRAHDWQTCRVLRELAECEPPYFGPVSWVTGPGGWCP